MKELRGLRAASQKSTGRVILSASNASAREVRIRLVPRGVQYTTPCSSSTSEKILIDSPRARSSSKKPRDKSSCSSVSSVKSRVTKCAAVTEQARWKSAAWDVINVALSARCRQLTRALPGRLSAVSR